MALAPYQRITKRSGVRLNVQLPRELKESLDHWAAQLHTTTSQLTQTLLHQGLETLKQQEFDRQLIAGYQYLTKENQRLLKEFRAVDLVLCQILVD